MTFNAKDFRNILGTFATGITVVTTRDTAGLPIGVTINSFASVSLDPPLVLFSLRKESPLCALFESSKNFNINILSHKQENISNLFAGPGENKFAQIDWRDGENNVPLIESCLSALECENHAIYDGGDHSIFIGKVTAMAQSKETSPLLYYQGKYCTVADQ